jgi:hypothetical protein
MQFFWVVTRCRLVGRCQISNETYCLIRAEDGECIFLQNFGTHPRVYTRHNREQHRYPHCYENIEYHIRASSIGCGRSVQSLSFCDNAFTTGILHA